MNVEQKRQELKKRKQKIEQKDSKATLFIYLFVALLLSALTIFIYLLEIGHNQESLSKVELKRSDINELEQESNIAHYKEAPLKIDTPNPREKESILDKNISKESYIEPKKSVKKTHIEQKKSTKETPLEPKKNSKEIKIELKSKADAKAHKKPKIEMVLEEYREREKKRSKTTKAKKESNISPTKKSPIVFEEYPKGETNLNLEDLERLLKIKEDSISIDIPKDKNMTLKKPLLVIIIDDVSNRRQLKKIFSLPYHITPSIFPPSNMNNHSNLLAKGLKHYMIHLPMESKSRVFNSMRKTLKTKDSKKVIADRIKEIRRLFPTAKYINNHTGSVFTSNYRAMSIAYKEILDNGFIFLDSVTTNKSVIKHLAKVYKRPYLKRDVFLDNIQTIPAILKQLKIAIFIAKKRGYAIAIGHPHKATFMALKRAKKILSPVKTVYIDELYKRVYEKD